jgi:hypothetical protein
MMIATNVAQTLVRVLLWIQLVVGALFWIGTARSLVPIHMLLGLLLVIALWILAFVAARAGVNATLVALAVVWGLIVAVPGMEQTRLLLGPSHWVIQVLHLLVGLAAVGLAEVLALRIKRARMKAQA